jgi:hydroxymethylpyrimidine pyrophosphatase-like HAD family hydrolase
MGLDYDGTLYDSKDPCCGHDKAIQLIVSIANASIIPVILTARAATAMKIIVPQLLEFPDFHKNGLPLYLGGGNGTVLYELANKKLKRLYSYGLSFQEIRDIVAICDETYESLGIKITDLMKEGLVTFQKNYTYDWAGIIPSEIFSICTGSKGRFFTEEAKVSIVLPSDTLLHNVVIASLQQKLDERYIVLIGDSIFAHVTRKQKEDGKLLALKTVMKLYKVNAENVVTFGDMPGGNDKGLLSFPYSFTNDQDFVNPDHHRAPYILRGKLSPVESVYTAIGYLLSK